MHKSNNLKIYLYIGIFILIILLILISISININLNKPKDKFNLVAIIPLTGTNSIYGVCQEKGINLALQDLNKMDVSNINVFIEDSQGKTDVALTAFNNSLAFKSPDAILTTLSPISLALAPVINDNNLIEFYSGGPTKLSTMYLNSIKIGNYDFEENCKLFGRYVLDKNWSTIAYLNVQSDTSQECENGFKSITKDKVKIENYSFEDSKEDFKLILFKINQEKPDAILVSSRELDQKNIYTVYKYYNMNIPLLCVSGIQLCFTDSTPINTLSQGVKINEKYESLFNTSYPNAKDLELFMSAITYDLVVNLSYAFNKCGKSNECIKKEFMNSKREKALDVNGYINNKIIFNSKLYYLDKDRNTIEYK